MSTSTEEIDARQKQFRSELGQWEENGDPLTAWVDYLNWLEARGLSKHTSYKTAIQKCINYFKGAPEYHSEIRLARIYLSAAQLCTEPVTIYQYMGSREIGVRHAPYYVAYSTALARKGDKKEALKVLEKGIRVEARPLNLLKKTMTELQNSQMKSILDESSERNDGFYVQSGIVVRYQKEKVYPRDGGEVSLEQIRGSLPRYALVPSLRDESGEDMEFTEAQMGHITVNVPLFGSRTTAPSHELNCEDELEALMSEPLAPLPSLQTMEGSVRRRQVPSEEEVELQIEELIQEPDRDLTNSHLSINNTQTSKLITDDNFEKELFSQPPISIEKPPPPPVTTEKPPPSLVAIEKPPPPPVLTEEQLIANKENVIIPSKKPFDFTPNSSIAGDSFAVTENDFQGLKGRLNFSEAELSVHQRSMHALGEGLFNTTLDCEKRIQLTSEQELFENEFADNEDDGHAYQPPSLINESSFGVFHDSWAAGNGGANMSKSAVSPPPSSQKNSSLLSKSAVGPLHSSQKNSSLLTKSVVGPLHSSQKNSSLLSKSAVGLPPSSQQKNSSLLSKSAVTQSSIVKNSSKLSSKSVIVSSNIPKKSTQVGKSALPRVEAGPPPAAKRQPLQSLKEPSRKPLMMLSSDTDHSMTNDTSHRQQAVGYEDSMAGESFSVYEEDSGTNPMADQTKDQTVDSFAVFHDSWADKSGRPQQQHQPVHHNKGDVYSLPMGAPVMRDEGSGETGMEMNYSIDQSFTQFDIPRPKQSLPYSAASTPAGQRVNSLTLNLSMIPSNEPTVQENMPCPLTQVVPLPSVPPPLAEENEEPIKPPAIVATTLSGNLSTITEESENYRSSQSSSKFTVSSGSSRFSTSSSASSQGNSQLANEAVDPFQPHIVNMMLNKLGGSKQLNLVEGEAPQLTGGCGFSMGDTQLKCLDVMNSSDTVKMYHVKEGQTSKTLKVGGGCVDWEVAVLDLLSVRLASYGLQQAVISFIQIETALKYRDTSFLLTEYPSYGSLKDLNRMNVSSSDGSLLYYYTCELVSAVAVLHNCQILHTNIRLENVMLRDLRLIQSVRGALGRGLCIVDFSSAVDLTAFSEDATFVGKGPLQCPQMRDGRAWKWQVDYCGLAGVIYSLLTKEDINIVDRGDVYQLDPPLSRRNRTMWGPIIDTLINNTDSVPLVEIIQPIKHKLLSLQDANFSRAIRQCFQRLQVEMQR